MKRSLLSVFVTLALALGLTGPASAATANPHASCAGLVGASRAGDPVAEAEVVDDVIAEASLRGEPPGATFGGFARLHEETAEKCLA